MTSSGFKFNFSIHFNNGSGWGLWKVVSSCKITASMYWSIPLETISISYCSLSLEETIACLIFLFLNVSKTSSNPSNKVAPSS